jgi:ankyrin repeat protein
MSLSGLPIELLIEIATHLDAVGILNALACTNRDVYDLLNERLYRQDVTQPRSRSLRWGAENGVKGTIRWAVDAAQKLELNPTPESFQSALQVAAKRGDVSIVELLLKVHGIDPTSQGEDAPLILAAGKGHSAVVESFLARDNLNPICMEYALGYAASQPYFASSGHVDVIKLLLDRHDVDPNSTGYTGQTALILGVNSPDIVKVLLDQEGIDVNSGSRTTALTSAAEHNYVESAKLLLEHKNINVNIIPDNDRDRWTPLHWACFRGSLEVVDLLLERADIDPNAKDVNWYSPLNIACAPNRFSDSNIPTSIIRSLLSHRDTDPNSLDQNGVSILTHFVMEQQFFVHRHTAIEILSLFRDAGARPLKRELLIAFLVRKFLALHKKYGIGNALI